MPDEIENLRVTALRICDTDSPDVCAEILVMLEGMKQRIRVAEADIKQRLLGYIEANGGCRIEIGDGAYYYAGVEKETKCIDVPAAVEALVEVEGGEIRGLAKFLSANAIKYGAARNVLSPERYATLFETTEKTKLKEGGAKPEKVLLRGDEQFKKHKPQETGHAISSKSV